MDRPSRLSCDLIVDGVMTVIPVRTLIGHPSMPVTAAAIGPKLSRTHRP